VVIRFKLGAFEAASDVGPDGGLLEYPAVLIDVGRQLFSEVVVKPRVTAERVDDRLTGVGLKLLPGDIGDDPVAKRVVGVGGCGECEQDRDGEQGSHSANLDAEMSVYRRPPTNDAPARRLVRANGENGQSGRGWRETRVAAR
jgi:hypothetical protein